jgi:hypothetical protein
VSARTHPLWSSRDSFDVAIEVDEGGKGLRRFLRLVGAYDFKNAVRPSAAAPRNHC